jgi:hypothetical protein
MSKLVFEIDSKGNASVESEGSHIDIIVGIAALMVSDESFRDLMLAAHETYLEYKKGKDGSMDPVS